jgi:hypothetical protein
MQPSRLCAYARVTTGLGIARFFLPTPSRVVLTERRMADSEPIDIDQDSSRMNKHAAP